MARAGEPPQECPYRWTTWNPWGGRWTHQCHLPFGHRGEHECVMDGEPHVEF